jgi:hypothetical protein
MPIEERTLAKFALYLPNALLQLRTVCCVLRHHVIDLATSRYCPAAGAFSLDLEAFSSAFTAVRNEFLHFVHFETGIAALTLHLALTVRLQLAIFDFTEKAVLSNARGWEMLLTCMASRKPVLLFRFPRPLLLFRYCLVACVA